VLGEENMKSSSIWSSCDEELGVEAVRGDDDRIASKEKERLANVGIGRGLTHAIHQ
jgi:hypothetical protein